MPRRHRIRRVLKWAGTIACALIVSIALVGCHYHIDLNVDNWRASINVGFVTLSYWDPNREPTVFVGLQGWDFRELCAKFLEYGLWPTHGGPGFPRFPWWVHIPLWIPFAIIGIPTAWLWRIDRQPLPGHCKKCNYNLTGNTSGRCPECGAEILQGETGSANEAGGGNATGV